MDQLMRFDQFLVVALLLSSIVFLVCGSINLVDKLQIKSQSVTIVTFYWIRGIGIVYFGLMFASWTIAIRIFAISTILINFYIPVSLLWIFCIISVVLIVVGKIFTKIGVFYCQFPKDSQVTKNSDSTYVFAK